MPTNADTPTARDRVRAHYPSAWCSEYGLSWVIVSGRGVYRLSDVCGSEEAAWENAAKRLAEAEKTKE